MEEAIVIGVLLISCVVLGITMLGDAELRETESRIADTHFEWSGLESDTPRDVSDRQVQGLHSLPVFHRMDQPPEAIEAPRILARQNPPVSPDSYDELSDDVFNRYRYFADELSRLREELAYSPVRAATLVMQRQSLIDQPLSPAALRAAPPIGTAFAQKRPVARKLADGSSQLPVADSVSIRV